MPCYKFPDQGAAGGGVVKGPLFTATLLPKTEVNYAHGLNTNEPGFLGEYTDVPGYGVGTTHPIDSPAEQVLPDGVTQSSIALSKVDANTTRVRNNSVGTTYDVVLRGFRLA